MLNTLNFKKLTAKALFGILVVGSLIVQSDAKKALASNGVHGIELRYRDAAIQCGKDATPGVVKVDVYNQTNDILLTTMSKGETFTTTEVDSISDLYLKYRVFNLSCLRQGAYRASYDIKILGYEDTVPNIEGFEGQTSISQMLTGLDSYEELYLVELGSGNSDYDLQDVVLVVDNNPDSLIPASNYAD